MRVKRILVVVMTAFALISLPVPGASVTSVPNDPTKADPKAQLWAEARRYLNENKPRFENHLAGFRGVPEPAADLAAIPTPSGRITKTEIDQRRFRIGDHIRCEAIGSVSITEEMANRFAVQLIIVVRGSDNRYHAAGSTLRLGQFGRQNDLRLMFGYRLARSGPHEVLYILAAHPLRGGRPAILSVTSTSMNVTTE